MSWRILPIRRNESGQHVVDTLKPPFDGTLVLLTGIRRNYTACWERISPTMDTDRDIRLKRPTWGEQPDSRPGLLAHGLWKDLVTLEIIPDDLYFWQTPDAFLTNPLRQSQTYDSAKVLLKNGSREPGAPGVWGLYVGTSCLVPLYYDEEQDSLCLSPDNLVDPRNLSKLFSMPSPSRLSPISVKAGLNQVWS